MICTLFFAGLKDFDISLCMNTDGVNIFKSSKLSVWPIFLSINECNYDVRRNHTILVSLWFGFKKPNFHTYLPGFIEQCNDLIVNGMEWTYKGEKYHSKVKFPLMAADSAARCLLQGLKQFNGRCGCPWCYAPGEHYEVEF